MRDRRAVWKAGGLWTSKDNLTGMVYLRVELESGRVGNYDGAPKEHVGRRVVIPLTPERAQLLMRTLVSMGVEP